MSIVPPERKQELIESLVKTILSSKNPYDVFDARVDDSLEDIEKKYKKISLQIHPDKCKHPQAIDAFNALRDALNMLREPDQKEKREAFAKVMVEAREKVRTLWHSAGKHRKTKEDERAFDKECKKMTQKILQEREAAAKHAEEVKLANEKRTKEEKIKQQLSNQKEVEFEELWEETRDDRVESWRNFQQQKSKRKIIEKEADPASNPPQQQNPPPPSVTPHNKPPPPAKPMSMLGVEPPKKKKKYSAGPLKPPRPKGAPPMG